MAPGIVRGKSACLGIVLLSRDQDSKIQPALQPRHAVQGNRNSVHMLLIPFSLLPRHIQAENRLKCENCKQEVLTGQGPAAMFPGQYKPPAGMPLPYTSCAAVVPSGDNAASGLLMRRSDMLHKA